MKYNRKFRFGYTRGDRNGIFVFCLLLMIGIGFNYWSLNSISKPDSAFKSSKAEDSIQRLVDSLKYNQRLDNQRVIFPFNPNFITDKRGYTLEMTIEEIDRLLEFRAGDQWINSKSQFQEVTQVSDDWMTKYGPYFDFPGWVVAAEARKAKARLSSSRSTSEKQDLNQVDADALMTIPGIGETLSSRILAYRQKLGGFVDIIQLKDVYGLKPDVIKKLQESIALTSPVAVEKLDINTASALDLSELPYFDYEMARAIVSFIKLREGISDFEELSKIDDFPSYKLDRIQLYLEIKE